MTHPGSVQAAGGPAIPTDNARVAHRPLAASGVQVTAGLLHDWQQRNREASLPLALRQLEVAGNLDNMRLALEAAGGYERAGHDAAPARSAGTAPVSPDASGPSPVSAAARGYRGPVFMDSDIYKTLEAVAWELARGRPDAGDVLTAFASDVIALLEKAQQPDGYLNSYIQVSGEPRYGRLASSHEMYCAGHLIQSAVAMHRAVPGEQIADRLLAVATRLADHLVSTFLGREAGLDGHPIIETALVELYRQTGRQDYLKLATQFVDQRGHGLAGNSGRGHRYLQDHLPVRDTVTEEGHVVRALYLEAGIVDVATETGDQELLTSSITRWEDMVATKTYLTGGNGSRHSDEAFGDRFELPPDRAYNETCAAIASFQWSWRLLLATGQARFADLMERVLYNAFAASVSTDGQRFFYINPLQRRAGHAEGDDLGRRHEWFSCACCPPNIMRLLASLHHYLATASSDTVYLHQYTAAQFTAPLAGGTLAARVTADFPWSGRVTVRVENAPPGECRLAFRIPQWSTQSRFTLNGQALSADAGGHGYLVITRQWQPGDTLDGEFGIAPRWVYPDPRIDAVRGCTAIERGPLVYCFEQADQAENVDLEDLAVPGPAVLREHPADPPGIGRTVLVETDAVQRTVAASGAPSGGWPYRPVPGGTVDRAPVTATAMPYFQWDNRDGRPMRVWVPHVPASKIT